jgi:hypothetical protein
MTDDMQGFGDNFWEVGTKAFDTSPPAEDEALSENMALEEIRRVLGKMSELNVEEGLVIY